MGFLDSLKKLMDTAESAKKQLDAVTNAVQQSPKVTQPEKKTAPNMLDSGNIPPKPSVRREHTCYGGANCEEYRISFMLSGDFIEFNSHCELDPAFQYEPDNEDDYTGYKDNLPQIVIGPDDRIYDAAEKFLASGEASGKDFRKTESNNFLFRVKFDYYGGILYAYAFSEQSIKGEGHEMFGLTYNADIVGTPLEKKLMAALDEAVQTYKEIKL